MGTLLDALWFHDLTIVASCKCGAGGFTAPFGRESAAVRCTAALLQCALVFFGLVRALKLTRLVLDHSPANLVWAKAAPQSAVGYSCGVTCCVLLPGTRW